MKIQTCVIDGKRLWEYQGEYYDDLEDAMRCYEADLADAKRAQTGKEPTDKSDALD